MDINELIIYRNLEYQELFQDMACLMGYADSGSRPDAFHCAGQLVELAVNYGFEGNLWHCFLAFCLANNENAYTTSCEITGAAGGSLDRLAREDFKIFKALFDYDIHDLAPAGVWDQLASYESGQKGSRVFNKRIRDRIVSLAVNLKESADVEEFQDHVEEFYREFGVGKFGLNKAFRIVEKDGGQVVVIDPIINVEHVYFDNIVGYQLQKQKLIENTEYYSRGLRIIEVYKHQFKALSDVLEQIKDRNYKFIIYMDDLSFEDYELEYKYLKAILEGGLGKRPDNVLIYATSNRRHLIREKFSDKRELDDELHNNDTVQEKLSLASRFGVTIYFGSPDKREFETIVKALADRYHLDMPEQELYAEANKWELSHGGLSGRTAAQFITHLLGRR